MQLNDFQFNLPERLIARYPLLKRSNSRLLCIEPNDNLIHRHFYDVIHLLNPGDLLVFNDTKVIPARLYGCKETGGQVEILVERVLSHDRIRAQVRASKKPRIGSRLIFNEAISLYVEDRIQTFYELSYRKADRSILEIIEALGEIPLPPYMHRAPDENDKVRYQTVYAKRKGSVAAPTAGLHFDEKLLDNIRAKGVEIGYLTLHIGAGTFAPVRVANVTEHKMHAEYLEVSASLCASIAATKARGNRVICVGTTSLRALETAAQGGKIAPYQGETSIFIYPGYHFNCVDALITNLHLPASTLLMLVCAFGGYKEVLHAYQVAVAEQYRFYSYGDAMWMTCKK